MRVRLLCFVLASVILAPPAAVFGQARRTVPRGSQTGNDAIGFRLEKVITEHVGDARVDRETATRQATEDFLRIQQISRLMMDMSQSTSRPFSLDLVARAAADVKKRADRLRSNLGLPKPAKKQHEPDKDEALGATITTDVVRDQIQQLDARVTAFVTDPMFQGTRPADKDHVGKVGENLQEVIEASHALHRSADLLSRQK